MNRANSSAKSGPVRRQAKPYQRPAQAQSKAREVQRCKCHVCLRENPLGVPADGRTILRHQRNDRRLGRLTESSLAIPPHGADPCASPTPPASPSARNLPSTSFAGADATSFAGADATSFAGADATSFAGADATSFAGADTMDIDQPLEHDPACASAWPPRVTVKEIWDKELHSRGVKPLPLESPIILLAVDGDDGVDVAAAGRSTVEPPEVDMQGVQPEDLGDSDDEQERASVDDADGSVLAVAEPVAEGPVPPVMPLSEPSLLLDPSRTAGRTFHDIEDLASLKLPRAPPRTSPLPPAPKLPPFKAALGDFYNASHDNWYIRSFFALAAVLHYKYHVSYLAVNLVMWTVYTVFTALGLLLPIPERPNLHRFTQTRTVLKRLKLEDVVTVYPTCPSCHWIAPPDSPRGTLCAECQKPLFGARSALAALRGAKPVPLRPWGYIPLSYLLSVKLSDDTIQHEIETEMARKRCSGRYHDMLDGAIMRDMLGHDGKPFFRVCDDGELRIGVTVNGDGFAPFSSTFRDNHSTTALSFSIASLNIALRYAHLLVPTLIPGPKEPTCQQLQRYLALIVDDLIMLYEHGILVYSEKYPNGRRVRVALVAVVCDHPAMCRMCGFADKAHKMAPCTKCKISQQEISTVAGVTKVYESRSGAEQKRLALEWLELPADKRDAHYAQHGQQWFELARLDYFDPVRQTVVGPMHCLLNGLMKNLWYETWIKGRKALRAGTEAGTLRELDFVHKLLSTFEAAPWVGRLPKLVGEPAGGSLSADEWKHMGTTFGPLVLPPLWYQTQPAANAEHAGATARYQKKIAEHAKAQDKFLAALARKDISRTPSATMPALPAPTVAGPSAPTETPPARNTGKGKKGVAAKLPDPVSLEEWLERNPPPRPPVGLRRVEAEVPMFLSFFAALRVLLARSLGTDGIGRGNELLMEHLRRFCEVYGETYLKYNQHWATHVPPQIPDFGPVYGFWEFPGERINKTLKSINTNNRRAGELELTMLRSYNKTTLLMHMLAIAERACTDPTERSILLRLLADDRQVRGTVDAVIALPGIPAAPVQEDLDGVDADEADSTCEASKNDEFIGEHTYISASPAGKAVRLSACEQKALVGHTAGNAFDSGALPISAIVFTHAAKDEFSLCHSHIALYCPIPPMHRAAGSEAQHRVLRAGPPTESKMAFVLRVDFILVAESCSKVSGALPSATRNEYLASTASMIVDFCTKQYPSAADAANTGAVLGWRIDRDFCAHYCTNRIGWYYQRPCPRCHYSGLGFQVHAAFDAREHPPSNITLSAYGVQHSFVVLDGRRIHPASSGGPSSSALVKLRHRSADATLRAEQGEVLNIFSHAHLSMRRTFATVRTFKAYTPGIFQDGWGNWSAYPELDVEYWYSDKYNGVKVVPIEDIACQVARARYEDPELWMTVSLEKHRIAR